MLDIPKIQAVCRKASHWDLFGYPIGGNYVHMHLFRPVVDPEELELWEELIGFTLPEDYRCYLTCLGNGGAGPYYGVNPFPFLLTDEYQKESIYTWGQEQRFHDLAKRRYKYELQNTFVLYEKYCSRTTETEQMDYNSFEEMLWNKEEHEVYEVLYEHGLLSVADVGCGGEIGLLLNGSHRGYVRGISREGYFCELAPDFSLAQEMRNWEPFASYFMQYVRKMQEFCDNLPSDLKRQALWERELVLAFQMAIDCQDWKEVFLLLKSTNPKVLSEKTTFFFKYHQKAVQQGLSEIPLAIDFYREIEKCRKWNYERYHGFYDARTKKVMRDGYDTHWSLALPTFQQFFQSYVDMEEDKY